MSEATMASSGYSAESFKVLKGLEPVIARPGMYTDTSSPTHIAQEVLDNAIDEALGGYATTIKVISDEDSGYFSVEDNGRGIPVDIHPIEGVPAVVLTFTALHGGSKFDKASGDSAYAIAGGLHGVGVSVTNALSERLDCLIWRDGAEYSISFENGSIVEDLSESIDLEFKRGTLVKFKPNSRHFTSPEVNTSFLKTLCKVKAALCPTVTIYFTTKRGGKVTEDVIEYRNGIMDYFCESLPENPSVKPELLTIQAGPEGSIYMEDREKADLAFSWSFTESAPSIKSFVNLIPTLQGGTHEAGMRSGIFDAMKQFIEIHQLAPKGLKISSEDLFKGFHALISVMLIDPHFQNQTKDKLTNPKIQKFLSEELSRQFLVWLNNNLGVAKEIANFAISNAAARQDKKLPIKKKRGEVVTLPGKLATCISNDPMERELFIVEGDSAGGSAKLARDKQTQAILPAKGKSLNTWEISASQILENEEIKMLIDTIGVNPHDSIKEADLSNLQYGKVCILSDADDDGLHIRVLLLTFFVKHMPALLANGHIFISVPPLYRIALDNPKAKTEDIYVPDDSELNRITAKLNASKTKFKVTRFKGLGEMSPTQLAATTLDPMNRTLLQVSFDNWEAVLSTFNKLMAKNNSQFRKELLDKREIKPLPI